MDELLFGCSLWRTCSRIAVWSFPVCFPTQCVSHRARYGLCIGCPSWGFQGTSSCSFTSRLPLLNIVYFLLALNMTNVWISTVLLLPLQPRQVAHRLDWASGHPFVQQVYLGPECPLLWFLTLLGRACCRTGWHSVHGVRCLFWVLGFSYLIVHWVPSVLSDPSPPFSSSKGPYTTDHNRSFKNCHSCLTTTR